MVASSYWGTAYENYYKEVTVDLTAIIIFGMLIFIYFLPTFIAFKKNKKQLAAIGAVNAIAGWTGVFWFMAFIWALMED